jgi:Bacteriophage related domain of unknown function
MALVETKRALERRLMALSPAIPTAFEGVSFDPPTSMYQTVQTSINSPDDPVLGTGYYRERCQFQVFIIDAPNNGTATALARAELTREQFKKGTVLFEGSFRIHILTTPHVGSTAQIGTRTIVPVLIDVVTEVLVS